VRRTADTGHALGAEDGFEQSGGGRSVRHEPLGERDDPSAVGHAEPLELVHGLAHRLRGNREQNEIGAAELVGLGAEGANPQVAWKLHAG
jgi:hypothetical protein